MGFTFTRPVGHISLFILILVTYIPYYINSNGNSCYVDKSANSDIVFSQLAPSFGGEAKVNYTPMLTYICSDSFHKANH